MPTTSTRKRNSLPVQYGVPRRGLPAAAMLRKWARAAGAGRLTLTLRLVGTREGRALNRRFRGKDRPTNVLSFPYGAGRGDIVLCHPVIAREARAQDKTLAAHYAHLVVHGVLHVRGYDHHRPEETRRMERLEIRLLRRLGFADPYGLE
jgi:probable rRNA maturation factor